MPDENAFQDDAFQKSAVAFQTDSAAPVVSLQYLRATLEDQSRKHRYKQRYRTFGRSE